jgi:hypothetical protein
LNRKGFSPECQAEVAPSAILIRGPVTRRAFSFPVLQKRGLSSAIVFRNPVRFAHGGLFQQPAFGR